MFIDIINKILFLTLFMSIFNVGRHIWLMVKIVREEAVPNTYSLPTNDLILLGLSLGYILTTMFTGITI
jgi:hypothetical protein